MKKVLITASSLSHIRSFHIPYIEEFIKQGFAVHIASSGEESFPLADKYIPLPFEKKFSSPKNFKAAAMLRKVIKAEEYSLIITHTSLAAFFTRLAVKGLAHRPKLINVAHGYLFDDESSFIKKNVLLSAEKLTRNETDLLLTMNEYDYALAKRNHLGKKIINIPGIGVDFSALAKDVPQSKEEIREKYNIPKDATLLIYPAELSKRKSQATLIKALSKFSDNVYLSLPGRGDQKEYLVELSKSLGVEKRVIFPGFVSPMAELYKVADVAVSSSRSEGLPFNVMEAMYMGLPVIASRVKGHTDLITEGETGLLFPYGDESECERKIELIINNPALAEKLKENAKTSISKYDIKEVLPAVMSLYLSL